MNWKQLPIGTLTIVTLAGTVHGAPRDVQIRSVNFSDGVIELHNFGAAAQSLSGWQLCTFDEDDSFRYTGSAGLNGRSIAAGESLFIHTDNDAPALPDHVNLSTLGGFFAAPLDATAYAFTLYGAGFSFIDPDRVVDHLMWNVGGVPGPNSGRANIAVAAGLWTSTADWIATTVDAIRIDLTDTSGGLLHGPDDYNVITPLPGDADADGDVDLEDYAEFSACLAGPAAAPPPACASMDLNEDGRVDLGDYTQFQRFFTGP